MSLRFESDRGMPKGRIARGVRFEYKIWFNNNPGSVAYRQWMLHASPYARDSAGLHLNIHYFEDAKAATREHHRDARDHGQRWHERVRRRGRNRRSNQELLPLAHRQRRRVAQAARISGSGRSSGMSAHARRQMVKSWVIENGDRPFVTTYLTDRWALQLSCKRPGLVTPGVVWDSAKTLSEPLQLQANGKNAEQ